MGSIKNMMVFIDGENLVMRYQAMMKDGREPKGDILHARDTFVWTPGTLRENMYVHIIRASYYTYAIGDDKQLDDLCKLIKRGSYTFSEVPERPGRTRHLIPRVFKKPNRSAKRKGVDINITVDVLTHTFRDSIDVVYLVTGDGDYLPLINEVMRNGKRVIVAALSSGLNPDLEIAADRFLLLDNYYFKE